MSGYLLRAALAKGFKMLTKVKHILVYFIFSCIVLSSACLAATTPSTAKKSAKQSAAVIKKTTKTKKTKVAKTKKSTGNKKSKKVTSPSIPVNTNIQDGVDQILSKFPNLKRGVLVQSADTGAILYQYNSNQTFATASTLKLFTATAALTYLGPDFIFKTQFLTNNNNFQNGELIGDLYAKFTGDPELTVDILNNMVIALKKQGIQRIRGNLIIDDTDMDHENMGPGWLPKEETLCYAAPSNAIILNRNCFGFNIAPSKQSGGPVQVGAHPNIANLSFINEAVTRSPHTAGCPPLTIKSRDNNIYALTGCIAPRRSSFSVGVALNDTRAAGTNVVNNLLKQYGIAVSGNIFYGEAPPYLRVLVEHDSRPLSALVTRMLKKSDNLIAGSLFKKIGGTYFNTAGSWQNGAQAVRSILAPKTGIDFNKMVLVDGSGLSREDAVSPVQFGKLLYYAYHMPHNDIFYQALPISGVDGTLRGRLGGSTLAKVHAKTGTIDNVSGLAGYIKSANHGNLIFAILVSDFVSNKSKQGTYHLLEDKIVQFLATTSGPVSRPAATTPVSTLPPPSPPPKTTNTNATTPNSTNK